MTDADLYFLSTPNSSFLGEGAITDEAVWKGTDLGTGNCEDIVI